jgi:hypothetical protein
MKEKEVIFHHFDSFFRCFAVFLFLRVSLTRLSIRTLSCHFLYQSRRDIIITRNISKGWMRLGQSSPLTKRTNMIPSKSPLFAVHFFTRKRNFEERMESLSKLQITINEWTMFFWQEIYFHSILSWRLHVCSHECTAFSGITTSLRFLKSLSKKRDRKVKFNLREKNTRWVFGLFRQSVFRLVRHFPVTSERTLWQEQWVVLHDDS